MGMDIYSMATTRQAELERALRRQELLRGAVISTGPSATARLAAFARRMAGRERVARPVASATPPIYCLTTRAHEPAASSPASS